MTILLIIFYDNYIAIDNYFDNDYFHDHHFAEKTDIVR